MMISQRSFLTTISTKINVTTVNSDELFIADFFIHVGDIDTLISFSSYDPIKVNTTGSERLRITSNGIVANVTDHPIATSLTVYRYDIVVDHIVKHD